MEMWAVRKGMGGLLVSGSYLIDNGMVASKIRVGGVATTTTAGRSV
jgi:hypothetical protein